MGAESVGQVAERAVFAVATTGRPTISVVVTVAEMGDGWDCTVDVAGRIFDVRRVGRRPHDQMPS